MLKICLIGPLPSPINGCSLANAVFVKNCQLNNIFITTINTSFSKIKKDQGKFSLSKLLNSILTYLYIFRIFRSNVLYITPGQTFFGILKYAPFILVALLLKKPYVIHIHGNYLGLQYSKLKGLKKEIFKFLISKSSAGIVLSESLRPNFVGLLPQNKVFIVENFATKDIFQQNLNQKNVNNLEILWLSNLMKEKGIIGFLDSLIALESNNIKFTAKIAGDIEVGLEKEIFSRVEKLKSKVEYVGVVNGKNKIDLLNNSNVFVFPTYYSMEGQPISIIEAMASGNIIVTTHHAGIPDIVNENNGYLVPVNNHNELVNVLISISNNLPSEIKRISEFNVNYAKHKFTEKTFTDKILNVLRSVH